jgi:hypothetical protein
LPKKENFYDPPAETQPANPPKVKTGGRSKDKIALKKSFLIKVMGNRNATWQGTITLIDRKPTHSISFPQVTHAGAGKDVLSKNRETFPFRSALEMLHLIDAAIEYVDKD